MSRILLAQNTRHFAPPLMLGVMRPIRSVAAGSSDGRFLSHSSRKISLSSSGGAAMNIRKVCLSILLAGSVASLSTLSYAQQAVVTPNYRQVDVRELVEAVGQITQTNVLIRDDVVGKVTFQSDAPMTLVELRSALISHLRELGYEVIDRDGVLMVGPKKP